MAEVEYKFPDEKGEDGPGKKDIAIEIVDDTPPEDKNRQALPKEIVDEIDKDDLTEYSEKVQLRMKQLKKAFHDERRLKETESREKQAAIEFAKTQHEENKQLKQRLTTGEKVFITEVTAAAKQGLEAARTKLKAAYDSGNSDQIVEAQELMADAKMKMREAEGFRPSVQDDNQQVQKPANQQANPKADAWKQKNSWFGSDPEATAAALGLHEKLVKEGVDPNSDDYYRRIDATMRKRFPENFEDTPPTESARKAATVVASASRTTAPRQVRLNTSEVAIAKRLGLTPEAYAREKIKLENANG